MQFTESPHLRQLERLMQGIPNFLPRGYGTMLLYGTVRRNECGESDNAAPRVELIKRTMSAIRYSPFTRRLQKYLDERKEPPMEYRNEKHKAAFTNAIEKLDRKNYALTAALYLLTADHRLWMSVKRKISGNTICFEQINLPNCSVGAYTLFCAAKDLYLGTKHLTVSDLADRELIPPKMFALICNAMTIRRYGIGAINFKERNEL